MQAYKTKAKKIPGTDFHEVRKVAFKIFKEIKGRSKRKPYVRSAYFRKDKIFLNLFWQHLFEKQWEDRWRRLQYFEAGLELIQKSRAKPTIKEDPNNKGQILYRFLGVTKDDFTFYLQIKEYKKTKKKHLISIFPT